MADILKDGRKPGFLIIDNELIDQYGVKLGAYGVAVYCVLARYAGSGDSAFPSYQTISGKLGISARQVMRTINLLIDLGLIVREKRKGTGGNISNLYTLVDLKNNPIPSDSQSPPSDSQSPPSDSQSPTLVTDSHTKKKQLEKEILKKRERASDSVKAQPSLQTQSPAPPIDLDGHHDFDRNGSNIPYMERTESVRVVKYKHDDYSKGPHLKGVKLREGYVPAGAGTNAVQIYHERYRATDEKLQLTDPQQDDLVKMITDLDKWRRVVIAWNQKGFNPKNLDGHLDWYRNGIPEEKGTHHEQRSSNGVHRANHQAGQRPHYANYDDPGYDEERANELNGWA